MDFTLIGEAFDGEVILKNCAERIVENEKDALGLLFWGNNNRIVCETACNLESSRSHCILNGQTLWRVLLVSTAVTL